MTTTQRLIKWNLSRTNGPVIASVSVADLKTHMHETLVDVPNDDLIEEYGFAADETVEAELSAAFLTQEWVLRLDAFPCWDMRLPRPPLDSVSEVQYVDLNGVTQVLSPTLYVVDTAPTGGQWKATPGGIYPAYGLTWPATRDEPNAVRVTYSAGKATTEEVPAMVRTAVKLVAADMYNNRERSAVEAVRALDFYERLIVQHRCIREFNYR